VGHRSRNENGRLISALQDWGFLQNRAHHGRHHGGRRDTHYATLTPWLNPILDGLRFWRGLEAIITAVTGLRPREEATRSPATAARVLLVAMAGLVLTGCGKQRVVPPSEWKSITELEHPNTWMNIGAGSGAVVGGVAGAVCTIPLLPILIATDPRSDAFWAGLYYHYGIPTGCGAVIGGSITGPDHRACFRLVGRCPRKKLG
jgi:hypothetical protein